MDYQGGSVARVSAIFRGRERSDRAMQYYLWAQVGPVSDPIPHWVQVLFGRFCGRETHGAGPSGNTRDNATFPPSPRVVLLRSIGGLQLPTCRTQRVCITRAYSSPPTCSPRSLPSLPLVPHLHLPGCGAFYRARSYFRHLASSKPLPGVQDQRSARRAGAEARERKPDLHRSSKRSDKLRWH